MAVHHRYYQNSNKEKRNERRRELYILTTFLADGIITIPVALAGYLIFPGIPESPKPLFLTHADIALAKARMRDEKVRPPGKLTLGVFKRALSRWHIYVFVLCYM